MAQNRIILITGGARSGKSSFAEELALAINNSFAHNKSIAYIATSVPMDDEFRERIAIHRQRRGNEFTTYEENIELTTLLERTLTGHHVIMLECITTWLGNLFHTQKQHSDKIDAYITQFLEWIDGHCNEINGIPNKPGIIDRLLTAERRKSDNTVASIPKDPDDSDTYLIIISNEVGLGIVPENPMAREFRDVQGRTNQAIASRAVTVYTIVSGIPVRIK